MRLDRYNNGIKIYPFALLCINYNNKFYITQNIAKKVIPSKAGWQTGYVCRY